jgi:hypothetical protein
VCLLSPCFLPPPSTVYHRGVGDPGLSRTHLQHHCYFEHVLHPSTLLQFHSTRFSPPDCAYLFIHIQSCLPQGRRGAWPEPLLEGGQHHSCYAGMLHLSSLLLTSCKLTARLLPLVKVALSCLRCSCLNLRAVYHKGVGGPGLSRYLKEANSEVEVWLQVRAACRRCCCIVDAFWVLSSCSMCVCCTYSRCKVKVHAQTRLQ